MAKAPTIYYNAEMTRDQAEYGALLAVWGLLGLHKQALPSMYFMFTAPWRSTQEIKPEMPLNFNQKARDTPAVFG